MQRLIPQCYGKPQVSRKREQKRTTKSFNALSPCLIYMKKFLDSDWLRAVQFQGNTVQEKGSINLDWSTFSGTVLLFSVLIIHW